MKPLVIIAAIFALTAAAMAQTARSVTPSAGLYNSLHGVISNPDAQRRRPPAAPQPATPPSPARPSPAAPTTASTPGR
jgi:hypothetical protein